MSKRFHWKLKNREIFLGERTLVMGVLNVTPDSFSDGGQYDDPDRAVARAIELEGQGADIIDIGAESTRPGSERISEAEELRRIVPVLKRLKDKLSVPISVDTYKASVAEKALEHGAEIINDPSGVLWDLAIAKVVAKWDAGLIVNHMRGTPETWGSLGPIKQLMKSIVIDLDAALGRARNGGVQKHQLVVDPGLGFGKRREQNAEILAQLGQLRQFDLPILVGPSRKAFLKKDDALGTEFATVAAVAAAALNGANIVRVHDVAASQAALQVIDAIRASAERAADLEELQKAESRPQRGVSSRRLVRADDEAPKAPPFPRPRGKRAEAPSREEGYAPPARRERERDDRAPFREERPAARGRGNDERAPKRFQKSGSFERKPFSREGSAPRGRSDDDRPPKRFDKSGSFERKPFSREGSAPRSRGADDRPPKRFEKSGSFERKPFDREGSAPRGRRDDDRPPKRFDSGGPSERKPFDRDRGPREQGPVKRFSKGPRAGGDAPKGPRGGRGPGGGGRPPKRSRP